MNCIFIKKVADTTINKKNIKFSVERIGNENYILEIKISEKVCKNITRITNLGKQNSENDKKISKLINKMLLNLRVKKFEKELRKIVLNNELIGYSLIFARNIKSNMKEYILSVLNEFGVKGYVCPNSMKENVYKYIEEYKDKNALKDVNLKLVVLAKDATNIDFSMIEKMNSIYKELDICVSDKVTKSVLNKVNKINEEYGTCIEILKKSQKDLKKYNICIFIDKPKSEYAKYKFDKKVCFIDFTNKENDKFNEEYIKLEKDIKKGKYYLNKIKELYELYGKITVSVSVM